MTVGELLGRMSGRELTEWQAYFEHEARVLALVRDGTDAALAEAMVWGAEPEA
jgi:hypothetical protein